MAFHTLPLMIGVSEKNGFVMNSLAVPRKAKQAVGGIAKLNHASSGAERYVSVAWLPCPGLQWDVGLIAHTAHPFFNPIEPSMLSTTN